MTLFYTTEKIGPKQSLTPEGFLLCEEVPIARTGIMIYHPDELGFTPGSDGVIKIFRSQEEVFSPKTIASAVGKPVTNNHPDNDVTPDTWRQLSLGVAMNIRRGTGYMDDLLLADFLITTKEGIEEVQSGKREVSCGYDADYEETGPGIGKQTNIIINHIALVDQGRCGVRCAISDQQPNEIKETRMIKKGKVLDMLMKAFKAKDAEEVEKMAQEVKDEDMTSVDPEDLHLHIHNNSAGTEGSVSGMESKTYNDEDIQAYIDQNQAEHEAMCARLDALEQAMPSQPQQMEGMEDEDMMGEMMDEMPEDMPEDMKENSTKVKDSSYLFSAYKDTVGLAEILVPGIKTHTFDRAAKPVASFRKICNLRRQALDLAWSQPATRQIIDELISGRTLDTSKMSCDSVRTMFRSAASMRRAANNGNQVATFDSGSKKAGPLSLADLNRMNAERYAK